MADITPAAELAASLASTVLSNIEDVAPADMAQRIAGLIPPSWFPQGDAPVFDSLVAGPGYNLDWVYIIYQYVLKQSRIATASGVWLDRISYDFLGAALPRRRGESNAQYRVRILQEILRERATRAGIIQALVDLTGNAPQLAELWNPGDCGAYDVSTSGYDDAGMYGDLSLNNQILVTAYRPSGGGVAEISGYGSVGGGYAPSEPVLHLDTALVGLGIYGMSRFGYLGGGNLEYVDDSWITVNAVDDEILATVAQNVAAGMTAWTAIRSDPDTIDAPTFYFGDVSNSQDLALVTSFF